MIVYVFGNPDIPEDSLPLRILPRLRLAFPDISFEIKDPNEEWDVPETLTIIDTAAGIDAVRVFTDLESFSNAPRVSLHDFDALTQTKFKEYIQHHQFDIQKAIASFFGADLVYGAYSGAERFLGFNPSPILTYFKGRDFIQLIPQETLTKLTESFSQKYFCNQKKMDSFFDEHKKIR